MLVSFALFGHTLTAAHVPLLLANIALPFVLYALYLRLTGHRLWAFVGASLILFLPFLQIYTLGASEPDPVLIVLVAALVWRVVVLAQSNAAIPSRETTLAWSGGGDYWQQRQRSCVPRESCTQRLFPRWSAVPPTLPPHALVGTWPSELCWWVGSRLPYGQRSTALGRRHRGS